MTIARVRLAPDQCARVTQMGLPNFDFHPCMVYANLRYNGVDLGKRHYIDGDNLVDL